MQTKIKILGLHSEILFGLHSLFICIITTVCIRVYKDYASKLSLYSSCFLFPAFKTNLI